MFTLVLIVFGVACVVWLWFKPRQPSPPVMPGALPFIGHGHHSMGNRKLVTDPNDSLVLANACLDKPYFYDFAEDICRNGLITSKSTLWKYHRKLLNPAFNQQVLNTYINEMNVQAKNLVSQLALQVEKGPFDVRKNLITFVLNILSRTSLGLNTAQDQSLIDKDYITAFEDVAAVVFERGQTLWLHPSFLFNLSSLKQKQDKLIKILNDILYPLIHKRKLEMKTNTNSGNDNETPGKFKSFMDRMIHLAEEQDAFTDDVIREHLNTILIAGFDTTTVTLKVVLLVIGSHIDVQQRIYNELQEVLGNNKDRDFSKHDLPKLVYLEAVIKETLRLYTIVPVIGRKLDTDVKLKNYTLRAGGTGVIGLYGLSRHPMWGNDVEQFKPERWLDPASLPDNPNVYAPFGVGKRHCIGKQYAMMAMMTALAHVLRSYQVTSDISHLKFQYDVVAQPAEGDLISLKLRR